MKSIILFGFKSCGKTYFGKRLAERLNWSFIDTDDVLGRLYEEKNSPYDIHKELGEKDFREFESKAIQTIKPSLPSVIALGGGSLLHPRSVLHLKNIGNLVYLKTDFSLLQTRIFKERIPSFVDPARPLDSLLEIYEKRKPLYESMEAPHIDISSLDEETVLEKLCALAMQKEHYGF